MKTVATNNKGNGVTIFEYVASNDPKGSCSLLKEYGFPENQMVSSLEDHKGIAQRLKAMFQKTPDKKKFAAGIIALHPDLEDVKEYLKENDLEFCGCAGPKVVEVKKEKRLSAEGEKPLFGLTPQGQNIALGIGYTLFGLGIIAVVVKAVK